MSFIWFFLYSESAIFMPVKLNKLKTPIGATVCWTISTDTYEGAGNSNHFTKNRLSDDRVENMDLKPSAPAVDHRKTAHDPSSAPPFSVRMAETIDIIDLLHSN